jgi:hypothetical protein
VGAFRIDRNDKGGAHLNRLDLPRSRSAPRAEQYELIRDLDGRVIADVREGLLFELLSIGQAVARSDDVRSLAETMRRSARA